MNCRHTGLVGVAFVGIVTASHQASAQDLPGFGGTYAGIDLGASGGKGSRERTVIDPARDDRFIYTTPPSQQTIELKRNAPRRFIGMLRAGHLYDAGAVVLGFEGQLTIGGIDHATASPIITSSPLATGAGTLGGITGQTDQVTTRYRNDGSLAATLRAGLPIADRVLVSVFGGPAIATSRLTVRQDSTINTLYTTLPPNASHFIYSYNSFDSSCETARRKVLFGGVVGGMLDIKLSDRIMLHTMAAAYRYNGLRAGLSGAGVLSTSVTFKPRTYSWTAGLAYRF